MERLKMIFVIMTILLLGNVFLGWSYYSAQKEAKLNSATMELQANNEKVLEFTKFFVANVLNTQQEVNFETRLKLENLVRETKDSQILDQWNKFLGSSSEQDNKAEAKKLLEILLDKI